MTAMRLALIAVLAVFAVAAAGCGGDDEATDDTTVTETTDTEATDTETTTGTETAGGGTIRGTVGPGFEISVDQTSVAPVATSSWSRISPTPTTSISRERAASM